MQEARTQRRFSPGNCTRKESEVTERYYAVGTGHANLKEPKSNAHRYYASKLGSRDGNFDARTHVFKSECFKHPVDAMRAARVLHASVRVALTPI